MYSLNPDLTKIPYNFTAFVLFYFDLLQKLGHCEHDGGDGEGEGDKAGHQGGGGALVLVAKGGVTQAQSVAL